MGILILLLLQLHLKGKAADIIVTANAFTVTERLIFTLLAAIELPAIAYQNGFILI